MSQAHRQSHLALPLPDSRFQKLMEPSKCIKPPAQRQQIRPKVFNFSHDNSRQPNLRTTPTPGALPFAHFAKGGVPGKARPLSSNHLKSCHLDRRRAFAPQWRYPVLALAVAVIGCSSSIGCNCAFLQKPTPSPTPVILNAVKDPCIGSPSPRHYFPKTGTPGLQPWAS